MGDSLLDGAWRLSPLVALRRKLTFLKEPKLVSVMRELGRHDTVRSALAERGVPETQWPTYESALRRLAATDMIRPRAGEGGSP